MIIMVIITKGNTDITDVMIFIVQQVQVIQDMVNLIKKKKKKKKCLFYVIQDTLDGLILIKLTQIIIVQLF